MKFFGAHVSASGGVENAPRNASEIGATAFALFTKNQRQWRSAPLSATSIEAFARELATAGISPKQVLPHDSYLINLGHPEQEGLERSREAFLDEMQRCEQLGLDRLNFHPGSHLKKISTEECLDRVAESINIALRATKGVTAVIENTAGQGSNVGFAFWQLKRIIDGVEDRSRVGVCLDTCHIWDGGYDIVSDLDGVIAEFDNVIGLNRLKAIHLNGSLNTLAAHKDRHAKLGEGQLPVDAIARVINHPKLRHLPFLLETPNELDGYAKEIALLKELRK